MFSFLSALTILILVVAVVVAKNMKITVNRRGKYVYSTRIRWVLGGYIGVLLICAGLVKVLPTNVIPDMKMVHSQGLEKENTNLYNAVTEGRIDKVDSKYISKKWNYDYHDHQLIVTLKNKKFLSTQVIVERKKMNDDKIEAILFKTRSSINDMDITNLKSSPRLELLGNRLIVSNPKKDKIEFTQFENAFSVNQFTGGELFSHNTSFSEGQSILYLRIPIDLEVIDKSNLNVEFVK